MLKSRRKTKGTSDRQLGRMMFEVRKEIKPIFSAKAMANAIGMSRWTVERWESGKAKAQPHQLADYCTVLQKRGGAKELILAILTLAYPERNLEQNVESVFGDLGLSVEISKPSIAVMSFDNLSSEPELGSVADGLAIGIIETLSSIHPLRVVSRMASFSYKGQNVTPQIAAREMGVNYLLTGTVQRSKKVLRISAELVDASTASNIWNGKYESDFGKALKDILKVQDELADYVLDEIVPHVQAAERSRSRHMTATNLTAWELVTQSWTHLDLRTETDLLEAGRLASQACDLDPQYALAYAVVAYVTMLRLHYGWERKDVAWPKGRDAAQKALKINGREPWAHVALGFVRLHAKQIELAAQSFLQALELNSNLAFAYTGHGVTLCYLGRGEEAMKQLDRAERLNPRSRSSRGDLGANLNVRSTASFVLEDYERGIDFGKKTVDENPELLGGYRNLVVNYALSGRVSEAKASLELLLTRQTTLSLEWINDWLPFIRANDRERYLHAFKLAGLN